MAAELKPSALVRGTLHMWRVAENNRPAKSCSPTASGRAQLERETLDREAQTAAIARIPRASPGAL